MLRWRDCLNFDLAVYNELVNFEVYWRSNLEMHGYRGANVPAKIIFNFISLKQAAK